MRNDDYYDDERIQRDFRLRKESVFRNCNVCGRQLIRKDELAIGMCAICANEEIPDDQSEANVE